MTCLGSNSRFNETSGCRIFHTDHCSIRYIMTEPQIHVDYNRIFSGRFCAAEHPCMMTIVWYPYKRHARSHVLASDTGMELVLDMLCFMNKIFQSCKH